MKKYDNRVTKIVFYFKVVTQCTDLCSMKETGGREAAVSTGLVNQDWARWAGHALSPLLVPPQMATSCGLSPASWPPSAPMWTGQNGSDQWPGQGIPQIYAQRL